MRAFNKSDRRASDKTTKAQRQLLALALALALVLWCTAVWLAGVLV
jgi:hypothetical protein